MEEMANQVNSMQTSWTAKAPVERFGSFEDVKILLGAKLKTDADYVQVLPERPAFMETFTGDIPSDWDVRTAFPDCADVSGHIGDQSSCGSCWAFGSTMAFNDRHCIATGDHTFLSPEDTTANCGFLHCFSMGCNGGHPGAAWDWFKGTGVVTGGGYEMTGQGATCAPYSLAPCAHHVPATEKYPACPSDEYPTPSLSKCTESAYAKDYNSDKIQAASAYDLSCGALSQSGCLEKIQQDMMQYGSATVAFTVYEDFPTYKSGVYKHVSGGQLGGHAVRLIGWGVENGEDYWLVANSWNEQWGDAGTFKIARGTNECGIEANVQAGTASAQTVV
jgi:cathepsin B